MTKIIYTVLLEDQAMNETSTLCAFETNEQAVEFMGAYTLENYGTSFDMRAEGVELLLEPTPYERA